MRQHASSVEDRFWSHVDKTGDCWLWTGARSSDGYGSFKPDTRRSSPNRSRPVRAHRFVAKCVFGMFDERLLVLHSCDTPLCVRPEHLRLGSHQDNVDDRSARGRSFNEQKTHCMRGHEFTEENTIMHGAWRVCRACVYAANRAWYHRQKSKQ